RRDDSSRAEGARRCDPGDSAPLRPAHDPVRSVRPECRRRCARGAAGDRAGRGRGTRLLDPAERRGLSRGRDAQHRRARSAGPHRARAAAARGHIHRDRIEHRRRARRRAPESPESGRCGGRGRMSKVLQVARRELFATVTSKAFLFGLAVVPVMVMLMAWLVPKLIAGSDFQARGSIAVVDPDGRVSEALRAALEDETLRQRREQAAARTLERMPPEARAFIGEQVMAQVAPSVVLALDERPSGADIEAEKARLYSAPPGERPFALVVLHEDVVESADGSLRLGTYDLYVPPKLDNRIE